METKWAGDPHSEWKTKVADENRLIVVDAMNHVIMISDSMETLMEWWPRTVKSYTHARVYREIDVSASIKSMEDNLRKEEKRKENNEKYKESMRTKPIYCEGDDEY